MSASQRIPSAKAREEDHLQYGQTAAQRELADLFPDRPRNHSQTLLFSELYLSLFNPLSDNLKKPKIGKAKRGPHGPLNPSPHEQRRLIIVRFISRWRTEVGNDIYPAFRLILPDKDRDRPVYGLKEAVIAKLLVKLLRIDPKSEDGLLMAQWKSATVGAQNTNAGDFAGRCGEVLSKRNERTEPGPMTIAEVNHLLDNLAAAQGEREQLSIFEEFYRKMNAEELKWLIRIIIKQMKVGATEKTFFSSWHDNAEATFNVSSSLRRVCWDLVDPALKQDNEDASKIELMSSFQPQLAQFKIPDFDEIIEKMMGTKTPQSEFWIEEKLDGERMQMHMVEDDTVPGGKRFGFWSRKGKDYTYLYGNGYEDEESALTKFLGDAFDPNIYNLILDGEMVDWDYDPQSGQDSMRDFGTLKTSALAQQKNKYTEGPRPLFRVFDCLFINDRDITNFVLQDRRSALERAVRGVHRRLEVHSKTPASTPKEIEDALRIVIDHAGEGLVLKNPKSPYRLNDRNNDWMKVKPEYMNEFGENLDCVIIGGYFGSGHRGGALSSFLCGLRVDQNAINKGADPEKFYSFFKVGGGFRRDDYAQIAHQTEGKWIDWDVKNPPRRYIELGGLDGQAERPDQWIRPSQSVVVEVRAASVGASDQFKTRKTLRFPRFTKLRMDKDWKSALSTEEFQSLQDQVDTERKENMTAVKRRRMINKRVKKELLIAGNDNRVNTRFAGPKTDIFHGLTFWVMTEKFKPNRKSKAEITQIIKANGGTLTNESKGDTICIGEKEIVQIKALMKRGTTSIVKPSWVFDAVKQSEIDGPSRERLLVPFEPQHMFHMTPEAKANIDMNVDMYGDSYARDVEITELEEIMERLKLIKDSAFSANDFLSEWEARGKGFPEMRGSMFRGCVAFFGPSPKGDSDHGVMLDCTLALNRFTFAGGILSLHETDNAVTHVVVLDENATSVRELRAAALKGKEKIPRIVRWQWLRDSWAEGTQLSEEAYAIGA